jgi:NTE family protein
VALVATDLLTGEAVALTEGDAAQAVLASSAFPGVFPPVEIDGRSLVDGGVVADIPLDLTLQLGAATALVLSVPWLAATKVPRHALDILFRASSLGVEAHGRTVLRRPPPGLVVVEVPAPETDITTFDVGRSVHMLDEGRVRAGEWLASD